MVLYPTGISSEVGLIWIALPYIKVSGKKKHKELNVVHLVTVILTAHFIGD
jgi:hypothetical protein